MGNQRAILLNSLLVKRVAKFQRLVAMLLVPAEAAKNTKGVMASRAESV